MDSKYDLAGKVIGCAMRVHRELGPGFLEKVYQKAMAIELAEAGLEFEVEKRIRVRYREQVIGDYVADIVVCDKESAIIVELKAVIALTTAHEVQLVNYLTATGIAVGLLLNLGGESLQFKKKYGKFRQN